MMLDNEKLKGGRMHVWNFIRHKLFALKYKRRICPVLFSNQKKKWIRLIDIGNKFFDTVSKLFLKIPDLNSFENIIKFCIKSVNELFEVESKLMTESWHNWPAKHNFEILIISAERSAIFSPFSPPKKKIILIFLKMAVIWKRIFEFVKIH